ncbi:MAG: hydrolase, partial [Halieaceae bacterium]|nr:hydrolase [Halieaceae bacterium]
MSLFVCRTIFSLTFTVLTLLVPQSLQAQSFDIVIENGRIMDPETGLDEVLNVGIVGDTIKVISSAPLKGKRTIYATGK